MTESKSCYTIDKLEGYAVLQLGLKLNISGRKEFEKEIEGLANLYLIVNCHLLTSIPNDWIRLIVRLQQLVKKSNKFLKMINVTPGLIAFFKGEGLDTTFKYATDIKDALVDTGLALPAQAGTAQTAPVKKGLDTDFINPFLAAAANVIQVSSNITSLAGDIFIKQNTDVLPGDVSGVIGIVSEAFVGSVIISFPEKTFLKIMSNMLGEDVKEINQEIVDGAAELTNMIFGQAKVVLNNKGYGIKSAIPSVISGNNHSFSTLTKGPIVVVPFNTEYGGFFIEICLSN